VPIKTSIITASCAAAVLMLGGCQAHDEIPAAVIFHEVSAALDLPQTGQTSGAVWVDLDDDGRRDLLLGRHHRVPEAYRHLDDLRFAPMPDWGQAMDAFDHHATLADDIDQDGHLDFYFVVGAHRGEGVGRNTLYLGGQDHTTNTAEPWGIADPFGRGRGVVLLDPDRDELPDLFVLNFRTAPRAYTIAPPDPVMDSLEKLLGIPAADDRSVASGTDRKSAEFIHRLLPLDLEADGQVDFLALGGALPLKLIRTTSGVAALDIPALPPDAYLPAPHDAVRGDFDGDHRPDLYLVYGADDSPSHIDKPRRNRLLRWDGERFVDITPPALALQGRGTHAVAADLDNSGTLDLAVLQTNRSAGTTDLQVFLNRGSGEFQLNPTDAVPTMAGVAGGLLAEDVDGDGDLDLIAIVGDMAPETAGGGVRLFQNDSVNGHSLAIDFNGIAVIPYGAIVRVVTDEGIQQRQYWPTQVHGSAYRSQLHLGLGTAESASLVEIRWPSGKVSRWENVQADQVIQARP